MIFDTSIKILLVTLARDSDTPNGSRNAISLKNKKGAGEFPAICSLHVQL